jgi:hypothetical protein
VFPVGKVQLTDGDAPIGEEIIKWCWAPVARLSEEEIKLYKDTTDYESKVDMEKAEYFVNYLEACKKVKGFALGDI